jgi:class 3 adenylate cyclase
VSAIHAHGGDVLKLIGDGILAIFAVEDRARACAAAIAAATDSRLLLRTSILGVARTSSAQSTCQQLGLRDRRGHHVGRPSLRFG